MKRSWEDRIALLEEKFGDFLFVYWLPVGILFIVAIVVLAYIMAYLNEFKRSDTKFNACAYSIYADYPHDICFIEKNDKHIPIHCDVARQCEKERQ